MSPRLPRITAADAARAVQRDRWYASRQSGSHRVVRHPDKPGRVVIPFHAGVILAPKTVASIIRDAGLTPDELRRLL